MPTVQLPGGETIWFKKTGKGAPLLQIHGSAFGHRNFEKMTPLMAESFEVIDFDLPGYGESAGKSQSTMDGLAEVVFAFTQAAGLGRIHIHGTSFGAMIGYIRTAACLTTGGSGLQLNRERARWTSTGKNWCRASAVRPRLRK